MRKLFLILMGIIISSTSILSAEENEPSKINSKYINFAFSGATLKQSSDISITSKGGGSITFGNTYFIKPLTVKNLLRFGIDAAWIDFNYDYYNVQFHKVSMVYEQLEAGVQVGPSITLTPTDLIRTSVYFRYAPTLSFMLGNSQTQIAYGSYFVGGLNASYKFLGIGAEYRFGSSRYKPFEHVGTVIKGDPLKTTLSGYRIYLTINF